MSDPIQNRALPVHERFRAWQGEGTHSGRAAFFIRLQGCPLRCSWCDAAGTWHPDWVPADVARMTPEALAGEARAARPSLVVVTGGEPAIHDLRELVRALHAVGLPVHLETSGAFPIQGDPDWVTVSPKRARPPLAENILRADEIKLIVDTPDAIEHWWSRLGTQVRCGSVWLQPEWSRHSDPGILRTINQWVLERGDPFRAAWQMHKLYRIDEQDPRSRKPAPLGGDPALGW